MDHDLTYLEKLIATGQEFTYRRARGQDEFDPIYESSKEKWTEWITMAEMAVKTFPARDSEALELMRKAKHLEVVGEIADDFYKSRELALSALRMCARDLREATHSKSAEEMTEAEKRLAVANEQRDSLSDRAALLSQGPAEERRPAVVNEPGTTADLTQQHYSRSPVEEDVDPSFWDHYGKPIMVGVAATVIGGLVLALLL